MLRAAGRREHVALHTQTHTHSSSRPCGAAAGPGEDTPSLDQDYLAAVSTLHRRISVSYAIYIPSSSLSGADWKLIYEGIRILYVSGFFIQNHSF